jgi:hypothetical protein
MSGQTTTTTPVTSSSNQKGLTPFDQARYKKVKAVLVSANALYWEQRKKQLELQRELEKTSRFIHSFERKLGPAILGSEKEKKEVAKDVIDCGEIRNLKRKAEEVVKGTGPDKLKKVKVLREKAEKRKKVVEGVREFMRFKANIVGDIEEVVDNYEAGGN